MQRVVVLSSSFESAVSCECVNVLLLSTTNGGVPSSPGGGVNNDLGRPSSVCRPFFAGKDEKKRTFYFLFKTLNMGV